MFMCPFDRVDVKMASKRSQMLQVRWLVNFNLTKSQVVHCTDCVSAFLSGVGSLLALLPLLKGQVVELSPDTRVRLEELQLEGDLLEVSLDQMHTIHRVLLAASDPPRETLHTLIQVLENKVTV